MLSFFREKSKEKMCQKVSKPVVLLNSKLPFFSYLCLILFFTPYRCRVGKGGRCSGALRRHLCISCEADRRGLPSLFARSGGRLLGRLGRPLWQRYALSHLELDSRVPTFHMHTPQPAVALATPLIAPDLVIALSCLPCGHTTAGARLRWRPLCVIERMLQSVLLCDI